MIPIHDLSLVLHDSSTVPYAGDTFCAGGTTQASDYWIDFGTPQSSGALGPAGVVVGGTPIGDMAGWGLHVIVTKAYTGSLATLALQVIQAATGAHLEPTDGQIIGERILTQAQLTLGAHYFIPFFGKPNMEFLGAYGTAGAADSSGKLYMFIGPPSGDAD